MEEPVAAPLPEPPRPAPEAVGWGWHAVTSTLVLTVVATLALGLIVRGIVDALGFTTGNALVSPALYSIGVGVYLSVIAGVYLFAARRSGWAALGLRAAHWSSYILVLPLFIIEAFALAVVNTLVGRLVGGFENPQIDALTGGQTISGANLLMLLVLVAGLVPFAEELFFRGMLYPLLRNRLGGILAIILNAAIFAVAHFIPLLMPGLFVVGLCLAFLRERSDSIWPSVCLHALQNGLVIISLSLTL
ncbi:MAG: CPBP family intramembrane metalloprotease [Chloroflexales bacterium]|nr:CPBP family intramembrane metalloprotease [Chloroflexales bacterium]